MDELIGSKFRMMMVQIEQKVNYYSVLPDGHFLASAPPFKVIFYWCLFALGCCASFCCTAKWTAICFDISSFFPLWVTKVMVKVLSSSMNDWSLPSLCSPIWVVWVRLLIGADSHPFRNWSDWILGPCFV